MPNRPAPLWTRNFLLLFITGFLMNFGFQFLLPTLPLYAMDQLGANPAQIGYLISAYAIAALLVRPFSGYAYDSLGKKKTYLLSMAFFTALTFTYQYAGTFFLFLCFRFLHGLTFGVASTGSATLLADIVPPARRGEGMGIHGLTHTLSMAVGPAAGLWILAASGYPRLFAGAGFFITLSFVISFFIDYPRQPAAAQKISVSSIFEKRVVSVAILAMCTSSLFSGVVAFITVYGKAINVDDVSLFFVINSLGVILTRIFAGRVQDRSGPKPVITFGYLVMAAGFIALSQSRGVAMLYFSALLIGLGNGSIMPALQAMVIDMVEPERRGVATSTHFMALDLGIAGGSVILGWVAELTSLSTMFFLGAFYLLLPLFLFLSYSLRDYEAKAAAVGDTVKKISYQDTAG
ncbi:MAG TPA: MFS transporter [Firmicutes bacterium]|nr:MFS transporter [Bacillota bacterium]